jgi:hypothetical protein
MTDRAAPLVFLGPTLPMEEAKQVLPATYFPPAAQGDIVAAVQNCRPSAILLVDGTFQGEPAVRHKEILWAISRGIHVFGAASMGALRAAELCRHGMIGVGMIYRWYRRFPLLPDDAVAVLHGPPELGFRALTHALVDLKMTFRLAERDGLIGLEARRKLDQAASALNFRDRSLSNVIDQATGEESDIALRAELQSVLAPCLVEQKRADALLALRLLRDFDAAGKLAPVSLSEFVTTTVFLRDLRHAGIDLM